MKGGRGGCRPLDKKRGCRPLARILLIALTLCAPAAGQEYRFGDVVIETLPDLPQSTTHGYHEFPFLVRNESPRASRRVTLSGPDAVQTGMELHSLRTLKRTVTVGPGSSVRLALLQPPLPAFGSGLQVRIDGRAQRQVIPWASGHPEYWIGSSGRYSGGRATHRSYRVLISQRLGEQDFPPHAPDEYQVFRAVMPIAEWSGGWLAYSGYDGVVTSAGELADAPGPVVEALWRYVETGGALLVLGDLQSVAPEGRLRNTSGWARMRRERRQASISGGGLEVDYAGFGVALTAEGAARVSDLTAPQLERLELAWQRSRQPWYAARDPSAAHRRFAVAGDVEVPVRGLFLVVLVFTVLIGPVNLALLTRRGKRMWLLWTVPAASLLTCAVVVLYVLVGEGLVRYRRTEGLTVLDERARRATTLGWTAFYATLTPGDGLRFEAETELTPVLSWAQGQRVSGSRSVGWGGGQHLGPGWLRARLPSYFIVRKSELRRERLSLRRSGDPSGAGALEAVNGLGVDLEALWVAGSYGRVYASGPLAAGAAGRLEATGEEAAAGPGVLRGLYHGDLTGRLPRLEQDPAGYLRPGTYLAVARASPFIEAGLAGLDRETLKTVIYGICRQPAPARGPGET